MNQPTEYFLDKIGPPVPYVTLSSTVGENVDTLLITAAQEYLSEVQLKEYPLSRDVFLVKKQYERIRCLSALVLKRSPSQSSPKEGNTNLSFNQKRFFYAFMFFPELIFDFLHDFLKVWAIFLRFKNAHLKSLLYRT